VRNCFPVGALAALLALAAQGISASAQTRTVIRDSIACSDCRLVLERALGIGSPRDSVLLDQNTRFIVAPDGRIFAAPTATPGVIAIYNSRGALTGTIGGEGHGPGEFGRVWGATLSDGYMYAIDRGGQRINVFGPTLDFVREIPLSESFTDKDGIVVIGSRIVVSSIFQTELTQAPVAILAANGVRLHTVSAEADSVPMHARRRYLTESVNGRFWVAPYNRYTLELWDTTARHVASIVRQSDWFRPWSTPGDPTSALPKPQLKSITEDAAGRLWVTLLVADSRWKPFAASLESAQADANQLYDTRIEVLDPLSGALLAAFRTDNALGKVTAPEPMFSSYRVDAGGAVIWTLHRPRLQAPPPREH
jgi:hypothetical protein